MYSSSSFSFLPGNGYTIFSISLSASSSGFGDPLYIA
jgi:hypothetical protein